MGVLHIDKVVRLGEIPERGSVDRPEGEPRGTPTLRGGEKRRKTKGTAVEHLEEKEKKQETGVLAANCKKFNEGNQQGAEIE